MLKLPEIKNRTDKPADTYYILYSNQEHDDGSIIDIAPYDFVIEMVIENGWTFDNATIKMSEENPAYNKPQQGVYLSACSVEWEKSVEWESGRTEETPWLVEEHTVEVEITLPPLPGQDND